jgi:hypothetical protein
MISDADSKFIRRLKRFSWVAPVAAMYLIWSLASLGSRTLGAGVVAGVGQGPGLFVVSLIVYLGLSVFMTQVFLVYVDARLDESPPARTALFLFCLGLGLLMYGLMQDGSRQGGWLQSLTTANLIVLACVTATWMTHPLTRPSELVPVCGVVALADLFSVFAGPTRHIIETLTTYYETGMVGPPPLADFILIKISVPGFTAPVPLFGVSDWVILVFLCSALTRFGLSDSLIGSGIIGMKKNRRLSIYLPTPVIGLVMALLAAQISGMFLPALPFMVAVFMVYALIRYPRVRDLNRHEWLLLSGFSSVMLALFGLGLWFKSTL